MIESLILNLSSRDIITSREDALLSSIIKRERWFAAGEDLVVQGTRPSYSTLLVDGFAARYKVLENGHRQITAIHIAGDFVDLHAFQLKTMDHGILALSPCHVAFADHSELKMLTETEPHLTRMLWLSTVIDGAIHREWIVAMGRKSAKSQLAHIFCELFVRLQVVRRTDDQSYIFPLSQAVLADVLGLSLVHLNKTLQKLRQEDVLTWSNRVITVLDWQRLQGVAEFDAAYLNLVREPR
ncbi:Crp/Fnr family transcriptional regulator [Rhizobium giardinii]|uniref:Crp/Fnr family transcriptional regulator n=1 Tax=Rhizobium giardinii TaxID=56731 RepID=UPI003D6E6E40